MKILGIEDNNEDSFLLNIYLKKINGLLFEYTHCNRLSDALDACTNHYDLIFLDLTLPDSFGLDTLTTVLKNYKNVPVIVLTGIQDDKLIDEILRSGAQDYLIKGEYDPKLLKKTIRYAIERQKLINQLNDTNDILSRLSVIDPMTGIFNRRGLQKILSDKISSLVKRQSIYVALLDIDDFKKINDEYGHSTGDVVLCEVATTLQANLRATDYLSRIGGDEFIAIITDINQAEVFKLAEKLRVSLAGLMFKTHDKQIRITCSIGLIPLKKEFISIDDILGNVKLALKTSKLHGKNIVTLTEEENMLLTSKSEIYTSLAEIVRTKNFIYQESLPIHDLDSNTIVGTELLTRSTITGMETPFNLFQQALEANMLNMLDTCCLELAIENTRKIDLRNIYINIYPSTLISTPMDYFRKLIDSLEGKYNVCFEISEQQIIGNPEYIVKAIIELRKLNIKFAIDDVGFGHTCLENLVILNPEYAKIDKRCTIGISRQEHLMRNIERIVNILNALKIQIVAEGIETKEDLEVIKSFGIKYGQGFFWGIPQPIKQL